MSKPNMSLSRISNSYGNVRFTQNSSSDSKYKYNKSIITSSSPSLLGLSHTPRTRLLIEAYDTEKTKKIISNLKCRKLERKCCIEIISDYLSLKRHSLKGGPVDPTHEEIQAYDALITNEFQMAFIKNFKSIVRLLNQFAGAKQEKYQAF